MKMCNMCKELKQLVDFARDCTRPDGYLYRCRACHRFLIRGSSPNKKTGPKPKTLANKFWSKVTLAHGCWKWDGSKSSRGYGKITHNRKTLISSRVSWAIHNGHINNDLFVLHKCDNPECTNPDHLFLGTQKDNMRDMLNKNRGLWQTNVLIKK